MKLALAITALVLGTAGLGAILLDPSTTVDVEILGMGDPHGHDRITQIEVRVHNPGPHTIRPAFAVPGNTLVNWYNWPITSGPETLAPGESANYTITQLPYTGVDMGDKFRVVVNGVDQQRVVGRSQIMQAAVHTPRVAVLNPGFAAWEHSMFAQYPLPYGWVPHHRLHGSDGFSVTGEDGALRLMIAPDQNRTEGATSEVTLRQRVDFPSTITVTVDEATRGAFAAGAFEMVGVSLEDVHAKRQIVIAFTQPPNDPDQNAYNAIRSEDYESVRLLVTNRSVEFDLAKIWTDQGWPLPSLQAESRLLPTGPGNVGFGGQSVEIISQKFDLVRPIELRVFVAAAPQGDADRVAATFSFVGGPAMEPARSRG